MMEQNSNGWAGFGELVPGGRPKIPKVINIVWCGGHDLPERCVQSWKDNHPESRGWEFKLWTDHRGFANQHVIDKLILHKRHQWNAVAYVMGYEILASKRGGILVQADSECVRPLDAPGGGPGASGPLVDFFNLEAWAHWELETARPGIIACGAMGASPYAEVFAKCVEEVSKADVTKKPVWETVGPGLLNRVAKDYPKERFKIFPAKMFCPEHHTGAKAPGAYPTYAKQFWCSTRSSGYSILRSRPCQCGGYGCGSSALFPPWG
jgi:mannosyltransferase OCH1-like enzyme